MGRGNLLRQLISLERLCLQISSRMFACYFFGFRKGRAPRLQKCTFREPWGNNKTEVADRMRHSCSVSSRLMVLWVLRIEVRNRHVRTQIIAPFVFTWGNNLLFLPIKSMTNVGTGGLLSSYGRI